MRLIWGVMRWGVWGANLNPTQVRSLIETGLENGITDYDHADIYGGYTTEALFGNALEGHSSLRDKLTLITKCGIAYPHDSQPQLKLKHYNTSGAYMRHRVEESLRFLRTDYIDRLLIHRPDVLLDGEEVAQTVEDLKKSGKIRSFACLIFLQPKPKCCANARLWKSIRWKYTRYTCCRLKTALWINASSTTGPQPHGHPWQEGRCSTPPLNANNAWQRP